MVSNPLTSSDPLDLVITSTTCGHQIKMQPILDRLIFRYLNEQQPMTGHWIDDHAFVIVLDVRIPRKIGVSQDILPPLGKNEGVAAINRCMRNS